MYKIFTQPSHPNSPQLVTQLTRGGALRSPLAVCLLLRYAVTLINDDPHGACEFVCI